MFLEISPYSSWKRWSSDCQIRDTEIVFNITKSNEGWVGPSLRYKEPDVLQLSFISIV